MDLGNFSGMSTFTHMGRNASGFRFLVKTCPSLPQRVLDVGSGPLEPVYFAHLLPPSAQLYAVDVNPEAVSVLEQLVQGVGVPLAGLAETLCNKNPDGLPRPNTDLTDPDLIAIGLRELEQANLASDLFYQSGFYFSPRGGAAITPVPAELSSYCREHPAQFDLAYAGQVLLNIAKVIPDTEELQRIVGYLFGSLKPGGVLGIGTTPADLCDKYSSLKLVELAGGTVTDLYLDNLVRVPFGPQYKVFGGYQLRAVQEAQGSPVDAGHLDSVVRLDPLLRQLSVDQKVIPSAQLYPLLETTPDQVILAAIRLSSGYKIYSVNGKELEPLIPLQRHSFSLLPKLAE